MDNGNAFKRRRLEGREREDTGDRLALELELRLLRAENARLLQERQQQHQQPQATSALDRLDRLAALRSVAAARPTTTVTASRPGAGTSALNLSTLALAEQRLNQLSSRSPTTTSTAATATAGLSRDQLFSLLGAGASSSSNVAVRPTVGARLGVGAGAGRGLPVSSLPGLRTATTSTTSSASRTSSTGLLGQTAQAFQQRLQRLQQPPAHTAVPTTSRSTPSSTPTTSTTASRALTEEIMKQRLQTLQQLSNTNTSARPTFNPSAFPTRLNNNNLSTLDRLMQNHVPPTKKDAQIKPSSASDTATTATTTTITTDDTNEEANQPSTGRKRKPQLLYMTCDDEDLSPYQTQVRKQIEVFEADKEDTSTSARGRNRPIVAGQVGIRCKHCKIIPPQHRQRAAIYYPSKLDRLYQMSQTIASVHLAEFCQHIPPHVRTQLARLREAKSAALGGKKYWADAGRVMGLVEIDKRLYYKDSDEAKHAKQLLEEEVSQSQSKPEAATEESQEEVEAEVEAETSLAKPQAQPLASQ